MLTTKLTPPAPLKMPQISPTTSPPKEDTLSACSQRQLAISKPFSSLYFSSFALSMVVNATAIISKTTLTKIKNTMINTERNGESEGSKLCDNSEKTMESDIDKMKTLNAHLVEPLLIFYFIHNQPKIGH